MDNKIAWEPWHVIPDIPDISDISAENELDPSFEDVDSEDPMAALVGIPIIPKVRTPLGYFNIDDPMSPINMCECWTGHTNFDITQSIAEIIESIPGVEIFRVISRYRFFIGVAKLFEFRDIRVAIGDIIDAESSTTENELSEEAVLEILQDHVSTFKRWAIFLSHDGFIDYVATNDDEDQEFDLKVRDFKADEKYIVITSED